MSRLLATVLATLTIVLGACAGTPDEPPPPMTGTVDLPLGDVADLAPNARTDATAWGSALTCKAIPSFPALPQAQITISIQGLTLHLVDRSVGYDKVFPIGPGAIDGETGSFTQGESLSYWPIKAYHTGDFTIRPSTSTACKTWWTDPETGAQSPVFAGLPFMSWSGAYAIHGPIDNFTAPNGGNLRRGFVSHGCVRLEAADILEIYARIHTATVPVHVQRETERLPDGTRVDVPSPWIGAECSADADCGGGGGFCKMNPYSERGFCSARCAKTCADRAGYPTTFCITDPDDATQGMCVLRTAAQNPDCRALDHFAPLVVARFSQPSVTASACVPGSAGAIGDHCFLGSDCDAGNRCAGATATAPGLCTQSCSKYCPDPTGAAPTLCVNEPALGVTSASCLRTCTLASNGSECPEGTGCEMRGRNGDATTQKTVCVPAGDG